MKQQLISGGRRAGRAAIMAQRIIADPLRIVVCGSEKQKQAYLKMGVPLKQIHVVTGKDVEAAIRKKILAQIERDQQELC